MSRYPVRVEWIPGVPQIAYRHGVGAYEGVVMHHIGTCSESADDQRDYEVETWNKAFVHEFIDYDDVLQVADPQYIAYGAGPVGNKRFVHVELCSADTQEEFDASYDRWCQRAAVHLANRQLGVCAAQSDGTGTLWSHHDVTCYLGGTDHTDPIDYLKSWGIGWQDVIDRVMCIYSDLLKKEDPENMPMELEQWQWDMLYEVFGKTYNEGKLAWGWMQKIIDKTMTATELAFLNTVVDGRIDRKIEV